MRLVASVSAAVMAVSFAAPAIAQPLRDTAIDTTSDSRSQVQSRIQAQTSAVADVKSGDAMPDNPSVELPDKVAGDIPDSATVVSADHAVTEDGTLKDIETGATVTDPELVGTDSEQPDPLAKTDGESFNPVDAKDVKDAVKDAGGEVGSSSGSSDASDSAESGDSGSATGSKTSDSVGSDGSGSTGHSNSSDSSESDASGAAGTSAGRANASVAKTRGSVRNIALGNNEYGAHWGTYNGVQAFFDSANNVFAKNAKGVVDVSEWQNTIDWPTAKNAGVEGAIVRIGYGWGNGLDKQAQRNISELKRLGIPFGVYLYSYAYDSNTAAKEGANVVNLLRQVGVSPSDLAYPVYYDLEAWTWSGHAHPTDPNVYNGIVNAWYGQLQSAGYNNLSVYSYTNYLNGPLNHASIHAKTHWVAQYGGRMGFTGWSTKVRGWQYTSGGSVPGMSGRIDLNAFGTTDGSSVAGNTTFNVTKLAKATVPNGTYYINTSLKDSSSVEIPGGSTTNGAVTKLYGYNNTKAQRFTFTKQSDGSYEIRNANSGKVLDVSGGNAGAGATVQQYVSNGTKAQRWILRDAGSGYYIQSALGNYVLDVAGGSSANGTQVRLWSPNGSDAQTFILPSAGVGMPASDAMVAVVSALNGGKVIDIPGASTADGARAQLYDSNDSMAQRFLLAQVGNGIYRITNVNSGKVLEVANGSQVNGAAVQQRSSDGSRRQHWQVRDAGNGKITFLSALSNKALDVPGGNASNGAQLQVYDFNGSAAQQWTFAKAKTMRQMLDESAASHRGDLADGTYRLSSSAKGSMVMDVSGASSNDGANVQLYSWNNTDAQKWRVSHDAKGYVTLTNTGSGKVLDIAGGSSANGANVQQYASNGTWAQKWIAVKNSDGSFTFRSAVTGQRVIDVEDGSTANGANIQIFASNGTNAQKWVLSKTKSQRETLDESAAAHRGDLVDGTYRLSSSLKGSMVMDVSAGSSDNGANVQLYSWNGTWAQKWVVSHDAKGYVTLTNAGSGKVLDVADASSANGANVQQYASNGTWAQKWIAVRNSDGSFTFQSAVTGQRVIDIAGGDTANGTNVQVFASNGTKAQKWVLSKTKSLRETLDASASAHRKDLADGTYVVASALGRSKVLDVADGSKNNGANVQIFASNGTKAQKWRISHDTKGYVILTNVGSGKVLDVYDGSSTNGANVQQYTSNGTWAQRWIAVRNRDGSYTFQSAVNGERVIDIAGGSTLNGANVQIYASNGTNAQKWVMRQ